MEDELQYIIEGEREEEAEEACDVENYTKSRAKQKAAVPMIKSTQTMLSEE